MSQTENAHFLKYKNWFQKQIWNKKAHISILNFLKNFLKHFFFERFDKVTKLNIKIWLSIVFFKIDFAGGKSFFNDFFSEKAKTLGIGPCFSGKVPIAQFQKCPVSFPPPPPSRQKQLKKKKNFFWWGGGGEVNL